MGLPTDIRNLRKAVLLSQESFAKELGVSFSTVNRWEMGKSRPSYAALKKLKNFLKAWFDVYNRARKLKVG